jgi:hypothetical protein
MHQKTRYHRRDHYERYNAFEAPQEPPPLKAQANPVPLSIPLGQK